MKTFQLGKDKISGRILDIQEVQSGLNCNCVCPNCGDDLVAVQGQQRAWYFRHHEQKDCESGYQKGLLALAIQVLKNNSYLYLPKYGRISYQGVQAYQQPSDLPLESDVVLYTEHYPIYLQFKLSEGQETGGYPGFENADENIVEIDLSDYVYESKSHFENHLLGDIDIKRVWSWQENHPGKVLQFITAKENRPWLLGAIAAGLCFGLYQLFKPAD